MSKHTSLVKKIEIFEKLAVYSDTAKFLNKISQRTPDAGSAMDSYNKINSYLRTSLEHLKFALVRNNDPRLQQVVSQLDAIIAAGINRTSAQQAYSILSTFERQIGPDPQFKALVQTIDPTIVAIQQELKVINYVAQQTENELDPHLDQLKPVNVNDLPQAKPVAKAPAKAPVRDPALLATQGYLKGLNYPGPLKQDGIMGKETEAAINWFRDTYKVPPAIHGQALYSQISKEYSKANPQDPRFKFPAQMDEEMAQRNRDLASKT